ncbi:MAG TPA: preprotein translocase subunit SecE [Aggregatilineales bacterium]|nr:preprotein translocase subunit SecE [Anaerolineae bacterium]HUN09298.1 preprotein translocase subunit SecE [Aggregatilineales bacterium]
MSADERINQRLKASRKLRRQAEAEAEEAVNEVEEYDDDEGDESEDDGSPRGLTEKKGYATPSRRQKEEEEDAPQGNALTRPFIGLGNYIEGVRAELEKVTWPTRGEAFRLTRLVLIATIVSSIILGIVGFIYNQIFVLGSTTPLIFGVLLVVVIGGFAYYLRQSNRRTGLF